MPICRWVAASPQLAFADGLLEVPNPSAGVGQFFFLKCSCKMKCKSQINCKLKQTPTNKLGARGLCSYSPLAADEIAHLIVYCIERFLSIIAGVCIKRTNHALTRVLILLIYYGVWASHIYYNIL